MPANEVAFGFRCTRRTSLLELTTTRLAEGLRAIRSLALEVLVTMVRDKMERSMDASEHVQRQMRHVIIIFTGVQYCMYCPSPF